MRGWTNLPSRPSTSLPRGGPGRGAAPHRRAVPRVPAPRLDERGLYVLEAGADDPQEPHQEDEVYVVLEGRAMLMVAGQDRPVGPGSVLFVARTVAHRFHDVSERLSVLVFFAPAESA